MTSVKWNGKEVQSPLRRKLVVAVVLLWATLAFTFMVVMFLTLLPIIFLFHWPLRLLGRKGTMRLEGTTFEMKLDRKAFSRR